MIAWRYLSFFCVFLNGLRRPTLVQVDAGESEGYRKEPAFGAQSWIFEMINLYEAWEMGFTGEKVKVRINDEDWEYNHIEWDQPFRMINRNRNAEQDYSCGDPNNRLTRTANDPPRTSDLNHGAAVTSIVGADGLNGFCGVGIAPRTQLSFCTFRKKTNATILSYNVTHNSNFYDISVNSFAHKGCKEATSVDTPNLEEQGDEESIATNVRNRRGLPYQSKTHTRRHRLQQDEIIEVCPFENFFEDEFNKGDDPCLVCSKKEFRKVKRHGRRKKAQDQGLQVASSDTSLEGSKSLEISEQCAESVRLYCSRNFRHDENACTDWIEVINNGNVCEFKSIVGEEETTALAKGVRDGRWGKGVVYIFATGNSQGNGDNTNFQSYAKSRYVMAVGAVKLKEMATSRDGKMTLEPTHSSYSTGGSSVFVVAPGGDYDSPYQHVGAGGFDGSGQSCLSLGYGTSFAAPVVAGVVALMLEANSGLGWRDVRFIIAETSNPILNMDSDDNNDDKTFRVNAAGYGYSELYGFGLIDAQKAVSMAIDWKVKEQHAPREVSNTGRSGPVNLGILDDPSSTTKSTLTVWERRGDEKTLESVSVYLKLRYANRGHLRITLESPSGTVSILSPGGRTEHSQPLDDEWWEFLTLRSWGETPYGDWTLSITDTKSGNGNLPCIDRPISIPEDVSGLGFAFTCAEYEANEFCLNGGVDKELTGKLEEQDSEIYTILFENGYGDDNRTASEACCVCGGGIKNHEDAFYVGELKEWEIIMGDGLPIIKTERIANYDPFLPEVTSYEFMRCSGIGIYGEQRKCCNGNEDICDLRVNEVLYATLDNGLNNFDNYVVINPEFEPERALEAGYRAFKLDVCRCNSDKGPDFFFCYGSCDKTSRRESIQLMMDFKEFLEKNPTELVILFFRIVNEYGLGVNLQDFFFELVQIRGFVEMIYKHNRNEDNWPTLGQLIDPAVNQRFIMFHHNGPDCVSDPSECPHKLHHYNDYVMDNNEPIFTDVQSIEDRITSCIIDRPELIGSRSFVSLNNIAQPSNFREQGFREGKRNASRLNQYYAVKDYVTECSTMIGKDVNFVQNDFWGIGELIRYTQDHNSERAIGDSYVPPTPSPTDGEETYPPTLFPTFFPTKGLESWEPTTSAFPTVTPTNPPTGRPDPCPKFDGDCKGCKKDVENCLWCVSTNSCYNRFVFENIFDLDDEVIPCAGEDILNSFDTTCKAPENKKQQSVYDDDFVVEDSVDSNETSADESESIDSESPTRAPADPPTLPPVFVPLSPPTAIEQTGNVFSKFFGGGGSDSDESSSLSRKNLSTLLIVTTFFTMLLSFSM